MKSWNILIALTATQAPAHATDFESSGGASEGAFYALTHLHPIVYLAFAVVVLISAANLYYRRTLAQSRVTRPRNVTRPRGQTGRAPNSHSSSHTGTGGSSLASDARSRRARPAPGQAGRPTAFETGGPGPVRKISSQTGGRATPLDGLNHPLRPLLLTESSTSTATPNARASNTATPPAESRPEQPFRFTSAVDIPSEAEVERRDRAGLSAIGTVIATDGTPITSALVYLADEHGARVGRPCRSAPDTGEFSVRVLNPGKYILHAYKRGYVAEDRQPAFLPAESGALEGLVLRLAPEGCAMKGRIVFQDEASLESGAIVSAESDQQSETLSANMSPDGFFALYGAAHDTEYTLRVRTAAGQLLAESEPIQTARAKEVYSEILVPLVQATAGEPDPHSAEQLPWDERESGAAEAKPSPETGAPESNAQRSYSP